MELQFFGASGTVTGSCYLLTSGSVQILVDFGMFQGPEVSDLNYQPLPFDPRKLTAVLVTHAHLDHCGRLPLLKKNGYMGKIYLTDATRALVELSLRDAANVAKHHSNKAPLYSVNDVDAMSASFQVVSYGEVLHLPDFEAIFTDAGHILGSASITITHKNSKKIVFSGDLGNTPQPLLQPTHYLNEADIVIMETTYGDRNHDNEDMSALFASQVNGVEKSHGTLLIPAFSLDRTQEVLHIFNHLKRNKLIAEQTPVYLDSPMAIAATAIYQQFPKLWSDELQQHPDDPFDFPNLHMLQDARESKKLKRLKGVKVIIAGNGMMSGGRIMDHAKDDLPQPTTQLFIIGYQADGTIGREIIDGATQVIIDKQKVSVNAHVATIDAMSAHADQQKLLTWIRHIQHVGQIFLVHGDDDARRAFMLLLQKEIPQAKVSMPLLGEKASF